MDTSQIDSYDLKAAFCSLDNFDYFAKRDDYIEVVAWNNAEGFDIRIHAQGNEKNFSLTCGELSAIIALSSHLDKTRWESYGHNSSNSK